MLAGAAYYTLRITSIYWGADRKGSLQSQKGKVFEDGGGELSKVELWD